MSQDDCWVTLPLTDFEELHARIKELEAEIQRLKEELDAMARKEVGE